MNGDGIDDIIVSATNAEIDGRPDLALGKVYVVFGKNRFEPRIDLNQLDGSNGFAITPRPDIFNTLFGFEISDAGDVNNDGIDDFVVMARAGAIAGGSIIYVIYGSRTFPSTLAEEDIDGQIGFSIINSSTDRIGVPGSFNLAGDVNGDGIDDLILGNSGATINGVEDAGQSYVVFGQSSFDEQIDLARLDGTNGFSLTSPFAFDASGNEVDSAVDLNNDGFNDLIVGAQSVSQNNGPEIGTGHAYIVFGQAAFDPDINLGTMDSRTGIRIQGPGSNNLFAFAISGIGDFNADGTDDFAIGALTTTPSYVVYGRANWVGSSDSSSCNKPNINRTVDQGIFLWQDCPNGTPNGQWHLLATGGSTDKTIRYNGVIQSTTDIEATTVSYERSDILKKESTSLAFIMRLLSRGRDGLDFSAAPDASLCLDVALNNRKTPPLYLGAGRQALLGDAPVDITTGRRCTLASPLDTCGRPRFNGTAGLYVWHACGTGNWYAAAVSGGGRSKRYAGSLDANTPLSNVRPIRFESNDVLKSLSENTVRFDMKVSRGNSDGIAFNRRRDVNQSLCLQLNTASQQLPVFVGRNKTPKPLQNGVVDLLSSEACTLPGSQVSLVK